VIPPEDDPPVRHRPFRYHLGAVGGSHRPEAGLRHLDPEEASANGIVMPSVNSVINGFLLLSKANARIAHIDPDKSLGEASNSRRRAAKPLKQPTSRIASRRFG
jgi:hypothetical protein